MLLHRAQDTVDKARAAVTLAASLLLGPIVFTKDFLHFVFSKVPVWPYYPAMAVVLLVIAFPFLMFPPRLAPPVPAEGK